MARTLIITNDFPPRIGGIESFVADVCELLDEDVVVYTSGPPGAERTDLDRGYPVVRAGPCCCRRPGLPTGPSSSSAGTAPLGSSSEPPLRWACWPRACGPPVRAPRGADPRPRDVVVHRSRRSSAAPPDRRRVDHLTAVSAFTQTRIAAALSPAARGRLLRLPPPVDLRRFRPAPVRDRSMIGRGRVAVGRFVAAEGLSHLAPRLGGDAGPLAARSRARAGSGR